MEDILLQWMYQKTIKIDDLLKGEVYEFVFDQHKAPLSKKVSEYLAKRKRD